MKNKIVKPDYKKSIIQVVNSIDNNFNYKHDETCQELDQIFKNKNYNHVILMLLDGLGSKIIDKTLDENSFLKTNKITDLISIYPSTTACATISTLSGKEPIETAWIGWENYFQEINRNVVLFKNTDYVTKEKLNFDCYKALPYDNFFDKYPFYHDQVFPEFGPNPSKTFKEFLNNIKILNQKDNQTFLYAYWTEPDMSLHEYGTNHKKVKNLITKIDKMINEFTNDLSNDTILIIVADHGHIDVEPIYLKKDKMLFSYLERMPANEGRCCVFKVKENKQKEFEEYFNKYYHDNFKLYSKKEFIDSGMLGTNIDKINSRLNSFLGDYIACATGNYYFDYLNDNEKEQEFVMKAHHAGLTVDEMLIPLIVYKK